MSILQEITRRPDKYGVTEKKKAELDALASEVLYAEDDVKQLQAIVTSLTQKTTELEASLEVEKVNKITALNNKELLDQIVDSVIDLLINSKVNFDDIGSSDKKIKRVALNIDVVINKLIYSAEVVNKLSNLIIRKKTQNPLISDELVTMALESGKNANNAVALTLTALNSVFASQATTIESEGTMSLQLLQAIRLFQFITGVDMSTVFKDDKSVLIVKLQAYKRKKIIVEETSIELLPKKGNIKELIYMAYGRALLQYNQTLKASRNAQDQLGEAESNLSTGSIKLNSLESGLAAETAAALAS
jgi:exonuclease VII small subunit